MTDNVVWLKNHARASSDEGQRSGRKSERETPVSFSIDKTNSAGTPRFDFSSQYQTCDCVVPMRSAKGFCPPAFSQARLSASFDMGAPYPLLGINQPRNLSGTGNRIFGTNQPMAQIDKIAFGRRVAARRTEIGLSQKALAKAVGMKQQGVGNIERGIVGRPRFLIELAEALQTSPEWLLHKRGPEVVRTPNALEEVWLLSQKVKTERLGAVISLLRQLSDDSEVA